MTARRSSFSPRLLLSGLLAMAFALAALGTASAQAPSPGPDVQVLGAAPAQNPANPNAAATNPGDPPGRVGRLAQITGTVSFHTSDESQWEAATLNYPITSGNSLWTEPQAHTAIDIGGSRLYLDSSTELDIGTLNDQGFQASLPQGAVYLRAGNDGNFEIDTPRGAVTISQPGHYEIVAGDATHPTTVTALDGTAQIEGPGVNMTVTGPQTASLTGQNPVTGTTGLAQRDEFVAYADNVEHPYLEPAAAQQQAVQQTQQYVPPAMTGGQDLGQYGDWQQTPDYGPAWFPQVAVDWAPYRYGHWAYIAPWGWTWIDDARWGFAPFHYGRWAHVHHRWCWVPGGYAAAAGLCPGAGQLPRQSPRPQSRRRAVGGLDSPRTPGGLVSALSLWAALLPRRQLLGRREVWKLQRPLGRQHPAPQFPESPRCDGGGGRRHAQFAAHRPLLP